MKSIKRNNGNFWMIGSFLIILILFLLLLSKTPMVMTNDTIQFTEVIACIEALEDDEQKEEYELLRTQYITVKDTTYGMVKELLMVLDTTGEVAKEYTGNKPNDKFIEREKFFSLYDLLITKMGKQNEIAIEKVAILGVADDEENEEITKLVTQKEVGFCEKDLFVEYQGYVANTYVKRNENKVQYLVVKDAENEKIELPFMYIKGQDSQGLHFQIWGIEVILPYGKNISVSNDVIASLCIEKGEIIEATVYDEKINGKVLSVNDTSVTLEKLGKYEFAENMNIYKVFDGLKEGSIADVALGYEFVDFVLADNKVCACLIVANEGMEYIRVLIKTNEFASNYHEEIKLSCDVDYVIYKNGEEVEKLSKDEKLAFSLNDLEKDDVVKIVPEALSGKIRIENIKRNQGIPAYSGVMEIHKKDEGLVLINEVLLEEYLYTVVPSEMPSYYHEQALMVQAICARTYAYTKMQNAGLKDLGAHLDDSTSFQVYNNIDAQVSTTNAVRNTVGQIVSKQGTAFETMYYSTSCGLGSTGLMLNKNFQTKANMTLNEEFEPYIESINELDFEANEAFYRWNYETILNINVLEKRVKECYNKNKSHVLYMNTEGQFVAIEEFEGLGEILDILVAERSPGGRAEKLLIKGSENCIMICGEYQIRYVLLNEDTVIYKQDGNSVNMSVLLPSAFIKIETSQNNGSVIGYSVVGGGYGHGNGMSQNGAGNMAKEGYSYTDILALFYEDCTIEQIY